MDETTKVYGKRDVDDDELAGALKAIPEPGGDGAWEALCHAVLLLVGNGIARDAPLQRALRGATAAMEREELSAADGLCLATALLCVVSERVAGATGAPRVSVAAAVYTYAEQIITGWTLPVDVVVAPDAARTKGEVH